MNAKRAPLIALTVAVCAGLAWLTIGSGPTIDRPDITHGVPAAAQAPSASEEGRVEVAETRVEEKQVEDVEVGEPAGRPVEPPEVTTEAPRPPASNAEVARVKSELPEILAELGTAYEWDAMTRIELEVVLEAAITQGQALRVEKEAGALQGDALRKAVEGLKSRTSDELSRILTEDERNDLMARIQGELAPDR